MDLDIQNLSKEELAKKFCHLHVHSHYSLLDGLGKVPQLLDRAIELGMSALAITDHGTMYGVIEFYEKAKEKGIKPIIGLEAYLAPRKMTDKTPRIDSDNRHLTLLAKNDQGYRNLIKITSAGHLQGYYYKPRIDMDFLREHSEGIVCLSGCMNGPVANSIILNNDKQAREFAEKLREMFGEDFYLELQYHPGNTDQEKANEGMIKLARELNIPLVATGDIHYIYPEDNKVQDTLVCIQTGKLLSDTDRLNMMDSDLSMATPDKMAEVFAHVPDAVYNTGLVAEKCNLELKLNDYHFPKVEKPENFTDDYDYLDWLVVKGMVERYGDAKLVENEDFDREGVLQALESKYVERMKYEMEVIQRMGFPSYFLIVWDFVKYAKGNGILVGPGRGSAAGSIVAYALKITDLCPIKYGLLFERFLNPDRISLPDIDLDFADDKRGEVLKYVAEKYGEDKVAQIITFGTMKARVAVRDAGRVMGFSYSDVDRIAKLIDPKLKLKDSIADNQDLKQIYDSDPAIKELLDMSVKLEGVARHFGMHACGVVISPTPLTDFVPLQEATKGDTKMLSQYSLHPVEAAGLVKMDFLGLANLTIMNNAIRVIRKVYEEEIDLDTIPFDDKKTYEMLALGLSTGVFQLESSGMKKYLKRLKPQNLDDVIAMAAMYRPGPLNSGMTDEFIDRKNGLKKIEYYHPTMENALKDTYGVVIYQEQCMQLSKDMAGFTGGQADTLRKAMGKKIKELMEKVGKDFLEGCEKNGISKGAAQKVFDDMAKFAEYGFNKAHSTCYGIISYKTAWLKANYPPAYMAAVLTSEQNNTDRLAIVIEECERMGLNVLPPDINESFVEFGVVRETKDIRYALAAIKNVGAGISEEIVEERKKNGPFKHLGDFTLRMTQYGLNRKTLESLIKCGAMDKFGTRAAMINSVELILAFGRDAGKVAALGQTDIFGVMGGGKDSNQQQTSLVIPNMAEVTKKELLGWEKELMGMYLSDHPLGEYKNYLRKYTEECRNLTLDMEGNKVRVGGVVTQIKKITTKKGDAMAFVTIEDLSANVEMLIFPKLYKESPDLWKDGAIVLVEGVISTKDGAVKILADKVKEISSEEAEKVGPEEERELVSGKAPKRGNWGDKTKAEGQKPASRTNGSTLWQAGAAVVNDKLVIRLPKEFKKLMLDNLKNVLVANNSGNTLVSFLVWHNGKENMVETEYKVEIKEGLKEEIEKVMAK